MEAISAVISATATYLPPEQIGNDELVASFNAYIDAENEARAVSGDALLERSDADFVERASGIRTRHVLERTGILDPGRMVPIIAERGNSDLSVQAEFGVHSARLALDRAEVTAQEVDLVICACAQHQRPYPAIAIEIQQSLGCSGGAFDMSVACSSSTFALHLANNLVRSGAVAKVLVVSPEIMTGHLNFRDRQTHFIFGDASAAVLVERGSPVDRREHVYEIVDSRIWTEFSSNIRSNFGFLNRADEFGVGKADKLVTQKGNKVFKEVTRAANSFIRELLQSQSLGVEDIKRFWLHQANLRMLELLVEELLGRTMSHAEVPITLDKYGNVASPGSIIAFDENKSDLSSGDLGLLCSFGAGYSIGGLILKKRT